MTARAENKKSDLDFKFLARCMEFLEEHKKYLGLSDWKIIITQEKELSEGAYAEADGSEYLDKILKISISDKLRKKDDDFIANTLFHELVHGRHHIYASKIEDDNYREEEEMINDIVRGFTIFKGEFKLPIGKETKTKNSN